MKPETRTKRQLRNEFIKSGAILLLAIVLLISVVLAWFGDTVDPSIEPFVVSINSDTGDIELGEDIVTESEIVLPAATILGDDTISVADFSKVIKILPLRVESPLSNDVSITLMPADGLHFYIDTDYVANEDDELSYAETIMNNHLSSSADNDNDKSKNLTYVSDDYVEEENLYRHMIAVVFWADYDQDKDGKIIGDIIRENGSIELKTIMSFKVIRTDSE